MTPRDRIRIVALGDSTTAGTPGFLSPLEAPPEGRGDQTSQYAYWLTQVCPEWFVLNRGVNGERSDQIRARFDRDVLREGARAAIIIAGVNDVYQGRPAAEVIAHLRWMYDRAREAGIAVVAGTIVPYNTATSDQNARMRAINEWIREESGADWPFAVADTRTAVAAPGNVDLLLDSPDQLHPSPFGYKRMAEAIRPVLEAVLRRSAGAAVD